MPLAIARATFGAPWEPLYLTPLHWEVRCSYYPPHYTIRVKVLAEFSSFAWAESAPLGNLPEDGLPFGPVSAIMAVKQEPSHTAESRGQRAPCYCKGKGATAKRDIPNDNEPGFVAEKAEHLLQSKGHIRSKSV